MSLLVRNQIMVGDARQTLSLLPDGSIDMILTSPPYFRLRNYQVDGQLGLEGHVDDWVEGLRAVCQEAARILVPTGTLWLNVADTYSTHLREGAKPKSMVGGPERLVLALLDDGWVLRNKIVWAKTNPMPTSVRDRLATTYEVVLVLARARTYFFDLDAVRQPHRSRVAATRTPAADFLPAEWRGPNADTATGLNALKARGLVGHPLGKNPGDVWRLSTASYRGAHFATYPVQLAERAIRAGCPEARCRTCRAPWRRATIRAMGAIATRATLGPTCACGAASEPGLVLDPFFGAGTTAVAAESLGRDWLGIELNPTFTKLADDRIASARQAKRPATKLVGPVPSQRTRKPPRGHQKGGERE